MISGTLQTVMNTVEDTNKECRCRKWVLKICKHSRGITPLLVRSAAGASVVFVLPHIRWNQQDE